MTFADVVFYVFAFLLIASSAMVVTVRNAVYAVLYLIFAFFNVAGLFVLIGAEFLAMLLVVVYVGAVAVLFLFVVMMLKDPNEGETSKLTHRFKPYRFFATLLTGVLGAELILLLLHKYASSNSAKIFKAIQEIRGENIHEIGTVLYTEYFYIFQLTGLILFVAMVAAIVLTLRKRGGVKRQNIWDQVSRDSAETVELRDVPIGKGVE